MRDQVVKQVAVEIERARLQGGEAIEPGGDRLFIAVGEPDVRVADHEDLSGRQGHGRGVYPSEGRDSWRRRLSVNMRTLLCSLLFATSVFAQTMPQLAPGPAGSKPIATNPKATSFTFVVAGDNRPAKPTCAQPPQ